SPKVKSGAFWKNHCPEARTVVMSKALSAKLRYLLALHLVTGVGPQRGLAGLMVRMAGRWTFSLYSADRLVRIGDPKRCSSTHFNKSKQGAKKNPFLSFLRFLL